MNNCWFWIFLSHPVTVNHQQRQTFDIQIDFYCFDADIGLPSIFCKDINVDRSILGWCVKYPHVLFHLILSPYLIFYSFCSRLNDSMILLLTEVETYRQTQEVSEEVQSLLNNQDMISTSTAQCVSNETYQAVNRWVKSLHLLDIELKGGLASLSSDIFWNGIVVKILGGSYLIYTVSWRINNYVIEELNNVYQVVRKLSTQRFVKDAQLLLSLLNDKIESPAFFTYI